MNSANLAIVGSTTVAVASLLFNWLDGRAGRRTTRDIANASRLFEGKRDAYRATMRYTLHQMRRIYATRPILDDGTPPPDPPTQDDLDSAMIDTSIFGPPELLAAFETFQTKMHAFDFCVSELDAGVGPRMEAWRAVEAARVEAKAAYDEVRDLLSRDIQD